ncbi:MAG: hypothetical protein ACRDJ5_09555 [Actinomycetota bacterium]
MKERAGPGPSALAGVLAAIATGGLMAVLAGTAGGLTGSLPAILALTGPLLVAGVVFGWLVDRQALRAGFGPGILFWVVALPASRLAQELMVGSGSGGLAKGIVPFLAFQALVGGGFGLGFVILHGQLHRLLSGADAEDDAASTQLEETAERGRGTRP